MKQKIEELNLKYSIIIKDEENYNTKFTKNFQDFYQIAIAAGEEDFQLGAQAIKKLKKLIDNMYESSKFSNQIIVKQAFESIQVLIAVLLKSTRWQDNNAGIWIIICHLESKYNFLDIKKLSQVFKLHLTQYLEESEEMFQENTSKLLTLLMNENNTFFQPDEYEEIQEKLINSQNNNQLIGLHTSKIDFQEKYISKIQLSPLLQILKELKGKTNQNNFTDLLLKCCLVNQKQTQLSAFQLLLEVEAADQKDYIEVLRYSLLHNNIQIIELGTSLAKHVIKNCECNSLQEIKLLIFLNQTLEPVKECSKDLINNRFKLLDNIILRDNFILTLNICSIQARNQDDIYRLYSWINFTRAINTQSSENISQIIQQIIKFCQIAQKNDKKTQFYFLHFIEQFLKKRQDSDRQYDCSFAEIICNMIGQFEDQRIDKKFNDIFKIFDFSYEQLQQLQNYVQHSQEAQQAWKELINQLHPTRQRENNQNKK
ncbi:unnamed protein product [Paramecium sonneborni]|uniref:Uncharacterized protein n=1 Tax=Paramecium sonneborni TaxID=65129 RepID=A0A8S1M4A7_9CILI|nr:unnamed protein product [Paramecium sonneborni]